MKKLPQLISIGLIIFLIITGNTKAQDIPDFPIDIPGITDTCENCPEDNFETQNFLEYAKEKFKNKFPFDAIEMSAGGGNGQCMTLNGKQECQVKEALGNFLNVVKFPIWIVFLIGLIKVI